MFNLFKFLANGFSGADPAARPPESVLVFPRRVLDDWGVFHGFRIGDAPEMAGRLLSGPLQFLLRTPELEQDERYKQVIACVVPFHRRSGKVWCFRRGASEGRLEGRLSCLVGGHVSEADLPPGGPQDPLETLWRAAIREMGEEISEWEHAWRAHHSDIRLLLAGCVNDDSDPVGEVHFGFVYVLEAAKLDIPMRFSKEAGQGAGWMDLAALTSRPDVESWSGLVAVHLASSARS